VVRTERFGVPRPGTPESPWLGELDLTDYLDKDLTGFRRNLIESGFSLRDDYTNTWHG